MQLNSYVFLFAFLPIALLGYYLMPKKNNRVSLLWLTAASLFFYGWSNPSNLVFITGSILFNFIIGVKFLKRDQISRKNKKIILSLGIAVNIIFLGYFKYANFFINNANSLFGLNLDTQSIILPLAISFFTIQQIAYLVDAYRGGLEEYGLLEYSTFVTFFPKLLSGPIVRHKEMMPEITNKQRLYFNTENFTVGITSIVLGLFKKVLLAQQLSNIADPLFLAASNGSNVGFFDGWTAALAYTFQLYFDFSGYCDIAIGLALMFNIRIPLNFYSPYKATSIIDFWRRWHMTLGSFIRDYLYIPLGGNRKGFPRQIFNILVAMTIIGFWHGAGWTFIIWGAMHGVYLAVNHGWRRIKNKLGIINKENMSGKAVSILITFLVVTIAWVFFRADSIRSAILMLEGMIGLNGLVLYSSTMNYTKFIWIFVSFAICWFLPNVQEYLLEHKPTTNSFTDRPKKTKFPFFRWEPSFWHALAIGVVAVISILHFSNVSPFIYMGF